MIGSARGRLFLALLPIVAIGAACSSSSAPTLAAVRSDPTTSSAPSAASHSAKSDTSSGVPQAGATSSPGATGHSSIKSTSHQGPVIRRGLPVTAAFAHECIRAGLVQTITIFAPPQSGVVYDAVYSDGKTGGNKGYYGGNAGGRTDAHGSWTSRWMVKAGAPPGPVEVYLGVVNRVGTGYNTVWFRVANASGTCS
jgi:hypothetical protein